MTGAAADPGTAEATPLRVAVVSGIYPPDIGGPATHAAALREELAARGHEVVVVSLHDGQGVLRDGFSIRFPRKWPWPARLAAVTAWLARHRHEMDVIYATGLHPAAVAGAVLGGRPSVVKIVGDPVWERARQLGLTELDIDRFQARRGGPRIRAMALLRDWSLRRASIVVTPSDYLREIVHGWVGGGVAVEVIPNGVDVVPVRAVPSKRPGDALRCIFVGRLVGHKRIDVLLEVAHRLPAVHLAIVGEGPDEIPLRQRADALSLGERVEFLGALPRSEVLARMSESHVFVSASEYEGLPHVVLEAFSCGLPAVTPRVGGFPEVVRDRENGYLVGVGDLDGFVKALTDLESDEILRPRMAEKARDDAFDWSFRVCVDRVETLLERVVERHSSGRS